MKTGDPLSYELRSANIDKASFERLIENHYRTLRKVGLRLWLKRALPIIQEPAGSGNYVSSGNYSTRVQNHPGFLITGTGVSKRWLVKDSLLYVERVDYDGQAYYVHGSQRPSRETLIHDRIYAAFPEVNAIIHTHHPLPLRYGDFARTPNPIFFANKQEADEVVRQLERLSTYRCHENAVVLPTHGQFVIGQDIEKALAAFDEIRKEAYRKSPLGKLTTQMTNAAVSLGIVGVMVTGFIVGRQESQLEQQTFTGCAKTKDIGTTTYVCSTPRNWKATRGIQLENGDHSYTTFHPVVP